MPTGLMPRLRPMPTQPSLRVDAGEGGGDGGGVDETRSLQARGGCHAPGWSPAAAGQRTRAAWSRDPYPIPAAVARATNLA
jgi:hypothetical protein